MYDSKETRLKQDVNLWRKLLLKALQYSIAVKGTGVTHNSVRQMLKNWRKQGLVVQTEDGKFRKNNGHDSHLVIWSFSILNMEIQNNKACFVQLWLKLE